MPRRAAKPEPVVAEKVYDIATRDGMLHLAGAAGSNVQAVGTTLVVAQQVSTSSTVGSADRTKARTRSAGRTKTYQQDVEAVEFYRANNPDFARLLFDTPINLLSTGTKVRVKPLVFGDLPEDPDPIKQAELQATETAKRDLIQSQFERRCRYPFEAWSAEVNVLWATAGKVTRRSGTITGAIPGMAGVQGAILDRWLTSGICGYRITLAERVINGVTWVVPETFVTYGGRSLKLVRREPNGQEVWGFTADGSTAKAKSAVVELVDDPDNGVLAGVVKLAQPVGDFGEPVVPYHKLRDTLITMELFTADAVEAMGQNESTIEMWSVDLEAAQKAGVPAMDQKDPETGTVLVEGAITIWNRLRQGMVTGGKGGRRSLTKFSWITVEELHPDLALLTNKDKWAHPWQQMTTAAGYVFSPDGQYMEEPSEAQFAADDRRLMRAMGSFLAFLSRQVRDVNVERFGKLNKTGDQHPFLYDAIGRPSRSADPAKIAQHDVWELLDGGQQIVDVILEPLPCLLRSERLRKAYAELLRLGPLSPQRALEVHGEDPDAEAPRNRRSHLETVALVPGLVPIWSPVPGSGQFATSGNGASQVAAPESPGRKPGVPEVPAPAG